MGGWRTVLVAQPCRLSTKNLQLVYEPHEGETVSVPLEDITVIVIENTKSSITTALLSKIAQKNIVLFTCDEYHTPNGCFTPFSQHSRLSQITHIQQGISLPLKKKLWQKVITSKISNQSQLLSYFEIDNASLERMKNGVKSGDSKNLEAFAAKTYWGLLFDDFKRDQKREDPINAALNYGYALVRGAVARSLVSFGLLPTFGIFHRSELNAYNLADDMIEPFRPMVDKAVKTLALEDDFEMILSTKTKTGLLSVLNSEMMLEGEQVTLLYACDVVAKTLVKAMRENNAALLKLPTLK